MKQSYSLKLQDYEAYLQTKLEYYHSYLKAKQELKNKTVLKEANEDVKLIPNDNYLSKEIETNEDVKLIPNDNYLSKEIDDLRANVKKVEDLSETLLTGGESSNDISPPISLTGEEQPSISVGKKHRNYKIGSEVLLIGYEEKRKKEERKTKEDKKIREKTEKICKEKYNMKLPETSIGIPKVSDLPYSSELVVDDELVNDDKFVSLILDRNKGENRA